MAYQDKIVPRRVRDGLELARFASLSNHGRDLEAPHRDSSVVVGYLSLVYRRVASVVAVQPG